jgi:hypothetical protein
MPNAIIERKQKLFRLDKLFPLDANQVNVEESVGRLFIYLRTGGRPITRTDKTVFIGDGANAEQPEAIFEEVFSNGGNSNFKGVDSEDRKKLLCSWFSSHFALMARRGKGATGDYRLMGLRPLHYAIIKLFNPQPKRQDRYLSDFFYTALRDDPELVTNTDSLFTKGDTTTKHGPAFQRILQRLSEEGAFVGKWASDTEKASLKAWLDGESTRLNGEKSELDRIRETIERDREELDGKVNELNQRISSANRQGSGWPSDEEVESVKSQRDTFNRLVEDYRNRGEAYGADAMRFNGQVNRYNLMISYPDGLDEESVVQARRATDPPSLRQ